MPNFTKISPMGPELISGDGGPTEARRLLSRQGKGA